jgi:hypothetical protein
VGALVTTKPRSPNTDPSSSILHSGGFPHHCTLYTSQRCSVRFRVILHYLVSTTIYCLGPAGAASVRSSGSGMGSSGLPWMASAARLVVSTSRSTGLAVALRSCFWGSGPPLRSCLHPSVSTNPTRTHHTAHSPRSPSPDPRATLGPPRRERGRASGKRPRPTLG